MDLRRDAKRIAFAVVAAAGLVGAAIGWIIGELFTHLHDESRSDHFRPRS